MKLYAIDISARNDYMRISRSAPVVLFADNNAKAEEKGLMVASEHYPFAEGWTNHLASAMAIPEGMIITAYQNLQKEGKV